MHFLNMLAKKRSHRVRRSLRGKGIFGFFPAFFTSNLWMAPLRNEVVVEKYVWEWEVGDIFRQQEQVVPHILQVTAVGECTVYSEELLSNSPETLTAPVCSPPARPDGGCVGPSRLQDNNKKLILHLLVILRLSLMGLKVYFRTMLLREDRELLHIVDLRLGNTCTV